MNRAQRVEKKQQKLAVIGLFVCRARGPSLLSAIDSIPLVHFFPISHNDIPSLLVTTKTIAVVATDGKNQLQEQKCVIIQIKAENSESFHTIFLMNVVLQFFVMRLILWLK